MSTRTYRTALLAVITFILSAVFMGGFASAPATASAATFNGPTAFVVASGITHKNLQELKEWKGEAKPNAKWGKRQPFTARVTTYHQSIRNNGRHLYTNVTRVKASINFHGTRMSCPGYGPLANGYRGLTVRFYFKDPDGRNFSERLYLGCESDTYVFKNKNVAADEPNLRAVAQWKANLDMDVAGHADQHKTLKGYFRLN